MPPEALGQALSAPHSQGRALNLLPADLLRDAQRQLEVCNACRYCEGVCAVFPAIERRTAFSEGDVGFLAHVCHDCRTCFYVCPYAPPHEFGVNIPKLMSTVREHTYEHYSRPRWLGRLLSDRWPTLGMVMLAALVAVVAASVVWAGAESLLEPQSGPGAFYMIMPWLWMFVPATTLTIIGALIVLVGAAGYWRDIGGSVRQLMHIRPLAKAGDDALRLRYLDAGGPGCDYPTEAPSRARKWAHHAVFWGFIAAFVSTTLAFIYQEVFGILPPYGYTSLPVIFGTIGGVAMIAGGLAFIVLKRNSDKVPATPLMRAKDSAFILTLLIVNASGLLLLAFRETFVMGLLLDAHLASVLAFYLTAPYGKLIHAVYRTVALIKNRAELADEAAHTA